MNRRTKRPTARFVAAACSMPVYVAYSESHPTLEAARAKEATLLFHMRRED